MRRNDLLNDVTKTENERNENERNYLLNDATKRENERNDLLNDVIY